MIFESHAHYDDSQFDGDREELLASLAAQGIGRVINIGSTFEACQKTLALTEQYDFLYGALGIHPSEASEMTEEIYHWILKKSRLPKTVAIGEIGLDYYWDKEGHEEQKRWFVRQLELARTLDLPVVVHSREAAQDTLDIIKNEAQGLCCDIHCFSYGVELARAYLEQGHYLGVGGVVTFKNAKKLKEVVAYMPLDRLLLETDCPYLAPVPHRGQRNDSRYLTFVAEAIAAIKGISPKRVVEQTYENAMRFYRLKEE